MSENQIVVEEPPVPKTLLDSKLYELAQSTTLLSPLIPNISVQMAAEQEIGTTIPRAKDDGSDTRILINYTNDKGNSQLLKITDMGGLERVFNIDHFLASFIGIFDEDSLPEDPIDQINIVLLYALGSAITTLVGLNPSATPATHQSSDIFLKSIVAILFDNPLDVVIFVKDPPESDNPDEQDLKITGMWRVKSRPTTQDMIVNDKTDQDTSENLSEDGQGPSDDDGTPIDPN